MQVWISTLNPYSICLLINLNGYKNARFQSWYACCMGMRLNPTVFNSNSHYMQFWLLLAGHAPKHTWRCRGSNPGPFTCKANALPLSYIPNSEKSGHIHWHIFTTWEVHERNANLVLFVINQGKWDHFCDVTIDGDTHHSDRHVM